MALRLLRLGAAAAALLLALLSRGDAVVLAPLLVLAAWRPVPAIAIGTALAATSWRWGSTSLEAWSGAQAVLGPGGWVGPTSAAASSWLAALAVMLAATRPIEVGATGASGRRAGAPNLLGLLLALAAGAAAAAVVAGPAPGGAISARVVATVVAASAALALAALRAGTPRAQPLVDIGAAVAGCAALAGAALDAPPLRGTMDARALAEGTSLALAAGVLVAVAVAAVGARRA